MGAPGWTPCTAAQWVSRRDGSFATHNYWTNEPLLYNGTGSGRIEGAVITQNIRDAGTTISEVVPGFAFATARRS